VKKVTVVFRAEQRGTANDALRAFGFLGTGGGYVFQDVKYSPDMKVAELTAGHVTVHVPMRNVLLVHTFDDEESQS
jgi:hypothetical protein